MKFAVFTFIFGFARAACGLDLWQTVAHWVPLNPSVAAHVQQTWSELQSDPSFNSESCPYPGDQTFAERELPWVTLDPKTAVRYINGQSEALLNAKSPRVSVNIMCANGKISLVDVISFSGVWKPARVYHGTAPLSETGLVQLRLQDQATSGLPSERYFAIEVEPNDVGRGRSFNGALLLARESDQEIKVISLDPVPEIGLAPRTWTDLNEVMLDLRKYLVD